MFVLALSSSWVSFISFFLQAQLAQTLFTQPIVSPSSDASLHHQPCNTPTGRTPSSSFSWGQVMDVQQRLSRRNPDDMIDDAEDERMVEEILMPSSPASAGHHPSASFALQQQLNSSSSPKSQNKGHWFTSAANPSSNPSSPSVSDPSSSFASTDPFYLAQLQAMQTSAAPSAFSQLGRPSQHSPFVQAQPRRESFSSFVPPSISLDTHNMFAATSVSLQR
ncbi:hypothetical protein GYMLUDRAFT_905745 [Collybiopsis luxurians FD-317 M1]|uniref:Uncharacterized protein n=1 Tax=Collybiopsis luxurians FD-317 M1 TaxID=944289 RepID=A0A0D0BXF0_9AGAR|nr:hypothetical protein GYMLUDRAFT_905745 [Collybiopsis luxurians FD-317 M1]